MRTGFIVGVMLAGLVVLGAGSLGAAEERPGPPSVEELEKRRDAKPRSFDARMALGGAYWVRARVALDERRFDPWHDDSARG